ncbi:AfsR/SARP family transcriptional regulator [Microtetraspora malaysiensis]|uniref:AfsR/SARP family transcriptional regulator n=1 Tax=Microtetraspora malaysiensis TaxID=161358 RepID=UPI003D921B19
MSQDTKIGAPERQDETGPSVHTVPITMSAPEPEITPRAEHSQVSTSAALITVRVLDQVTVYGPARSADCSRGKDVADLLGLLVVHREGLTRERAYQVLWPDITLDHYDCFHGPKSELRDKLVRVLGRPHQGKNLLQYVGGRYRLNPALVTADLWQLRDALAEAKQADSPEQMIASLRRAVDLYAGPFLPAGTHPWATEVAEDLRHDVIQALLRLSELDPAADRVTAVLERAHRLDPVNEQVSCRMMRHFSALGRNDAVYATYRDLCQALAELDGLSPSAKTRELYGRLTGHVS